MKIKNVQLIYFSATNSTQQVVRLISGGFSPLERVEHDITQGISDSKALRTDELAIFAVPVYSGRIPYIAVEALNKFSGVNSPAIIVCVYGNREYDDALLELKGVVELNGFKVVAAGAFIAEHSIFRKVASGRPDEMDKLAALEFGKRCMQLLQETDRVELLPAIHVKGNFPYREIYNIPLKPKSGQSCNKCKVCVSVCPTGAIDAGNPKRTDKEKCISCARCIAVCPQHARHFGGLLYRLAGKSFVAKNTARKEAELIYAH